MAVLLIPSEQTLTFLFNLLVRESVRHYKGDPATSQPLGWLLHMKKKKNNKCW